MTEEIWNDIDECPNYLISNQGRVKNKKSQYIIKSKVRNNLYVEVTLNRNKKPATFKLHRLIAIAFIPNPDNKKTVNHKDGNKTNNNIENLEWATMSEQNLEKNKNIKNYKGNVCVRAIQKIDLKTNTCIKTYDSPQDAANWIFDNCKINSKSVNHINKSMAPKISAVCRGQRQSAYGFKWCFVETSQKQNEEWSEISPEIINGKKGYFVSSCGRIKCPNGHVKENYRFSTGYKRLCVGEKNFLLHRIVALTFLKNPENKPQVNHKDGNKLNNRLENLEWASALENNLHKIQTGLSNCTKKVIQYDANGEIIKQHNSIKDAAKYAELNVSTVSNNLRGVTSFTKSGFQFCYAKDINEL